MHRSRLNEKEKKLKKEIHELKETIQKEIHEYNKKYGGPGPMKFHPEAIKLNNKINEHKKELKKLRSDIHEYRRKGKRYRPS